MVIGGTVTVWGIVKVAGACSDSGGVHTDGPSSRRTRSYTSLPLPPLTTTIKSCTGPHEGQEDMQVRAVFAGYQVCMMHEEICCKLRGK